MSKTLNPTQASIGAVRAAVTNLTIDEAALHAHVMNPDHLRGVHSYKGLQEEPGLRSLPLSPSPEAKGPLKHLDVGGFGTALHNELKNEVAGYVMCLRQSGQTIYTLQWNWAHTPADGSLGWNPDRQMHVASVSKLVTAIAMTKLLDAKGISYDAKIINYLPSYWVKGPNTDKITFRHLMTHTSGFQAGGQTDFATMKSRVAMGVNGVGQYHYENMNFGLCRILIAIINGNVDKHAMIGDSAWDFVTILGYKMDVAAGLLAPAGAAGGTLTHAAGCALAYNFPPVIGGWNSGNLETVSGGAGWHLSVNQLLDVMGTFRRKGTIMSVAKAKTMLDSGFGIDVIQDTAAGRLYNKNGLWADGSGRTEQSLAYFLPQDMEMVVLTNSPVALPAKFFRSVVTNLYLAHLA